MDGIPGGDGFSIGVPGFSIGIYGDLSWKDSGQLPWKIRSAGRCSAQNTLINRFKKLSTRF